MIDFALNYSMENKIAVTIMYQKGNEITQRNVKILRMDKVHIHAFCYTKKAIRSFKKEQILAAFIPGTGIKSRGSFQTLQ